MCLNAFSAPNSLCDLANNFTFVPYTLEWKKILALPNPTDSYESPMRYGLWKSIVMKAKCIKSIKVQFILSYVQTDKFTLDVRRMLWKWLGSC